MTAIWPEKETEVAAPVVAWLRESGWDVYQEVECRVRRADIVARRGRLVWVIEVKRSLDLNLMTQGRGWIGLAHMVSLAYPRRRNSRTADAAKHYASMDGLGLVEVFRTWKLRDGGRDVAVLRVEEMARPAMNRRARPKFRLTEAHQTYAEAGNADGRFWSPFKETCTAVAAVVSEHPGLTIREVVDRVDHHYASKQSARGSLLTWARSGKLDGVVVRGGSKAEGAMRLFPADWSGPIMSRKLLAEAVAKRNDPSARRF